MDTSTLTAFDIAVLAIVGLSAIFAFTRGFVTVALSFVAWAGALVGAIFGFQVASPYGRELITIPDLADFVTYVVLFFVILFVLKRIAEMVGGFVKDSPVGFLDRSAGALFGMLRGMVIVSILYLGFSKLFGAEDQPVWMKDAQLRPLVAWGAEMLEGYAAEALGKNPTDVGADYLQRAADSVPSQFINEKLEEQAAKYMETQRDQLNDLVEEIAKEKPKDDGSR